jgi:predicted NBD/HSP70 family sugar kinase
MIAKANIDRSQLIGTGIGIPNMLSHIELPNQPKAYFEWDNVDIPTLFAGVVDGPVFVENDATAGALGEMQFGHRLRNPSFFYILINVGLGGGLVIDGIPFRGAHGRSGEFSGVPLRSNQSAVSDLGQAVSLRGLYRTLQSGGYSISRPSELPSLDESGQTLVDKWLDDAAVFLLDPLIAMFSFVDPESVVIGGRLPPSCVDRLVGRLNVALQSHGSDALASIPVQRGVLGEDGPAIGAALLPLNERLFPTRSALVKTAEA